jgi:hypothetical protein
MDEIMIKLEDERTYAIKISDYSSITIYADVIMLVRADGVTEMISRGLSHHLIREIKIV